MTPYKDQHRYFIELQLAAGQQVPRNREAEIRRAHAATFIERIASWLNERELEDKVASMAITALGQVRITCDHDLITRLRNDEALDIAAIRPGAALSDSVFRAAR
jgi:hypothetical protein